MNRVFVLEWLWCDGRESCNGLLGVFANYESAEKEGKAYLDFQVNENYDFEIREFEVKS